MLCTSRITGMHGDLDQYSDWKTEIPLRCSPTPSTTPGRGNIVQLKDSDHDKVIHSACALHPAAALDATIGEGAAIGEAHLCGEWTGTRLMEIDNPPEDEVVLLTPVESINVQTNGDNSHPPVDLPIVEIITEPSTLLQDESDPPMVEIISESNDDTNLNQADRPTVEIITWQSIPTRRRRATESSQPFQPRLRLDTSIIPVVGPFTSPTYESPSQRRRRERRTSGMPHAIVPITNVDIVAGSTVCIDLVESPVLQTPRGRRSRRCVSPDRRRDGEIDILDESDENEDGHIAFRGRQKKRPSELKCFGSSSFGPKRAYPGQTPVEPPGDSHGTDFRRLPVEPALRKRVSDWIGQNARVVEFVSTPISPVPEVWSP